MKRRDLATESTEGTEESENAGVSRVRPFARCPRAPARVYVRPLRRGGKPRTADAFGPSRGHRISAPPGRPNVDPGGSPGTPGERPHQSRKPAEMGHHHPDPVCLSLFSLLSVISVANPPELRPG
ncbi:hypothetical protein FRUB_02078 [Fimbriiglobus ruber]|uniref:Uncharacterized protein n=1 Tax=Fimbriiglobus ruber TaxID=1908690 RepID=A0A225EBJ5_9BACT|nr:hypothetical protein FRUB_02078 [Fimbriiglobus ruber]